MASKNNEKEKDTLDNDNNSQDSNKSKKMDKREIYKMRQKNKQIEI